MTLLDTVAIDDGVVNAVRIGDNIEAYGEMHGAPNGFVHYLATHLELLDNYMVLVEQRESGCVAPDNIQDRANWMRAVDNIQQPGIPELFASLLKAGATNIRCIDPRDDIGFPDDPQFFRDITRFIRKFTGDPEQYTLERIVGPLGDLITIVRYLELDFEDAGYRELYDEYLALIDHDYDIVSNSSAHGVEYIGACAHRLVKNIMRFSALYFDIAIERILREYLDGGRKVVLFLGAAHVYKLGNTPPTDIPTHWLKKTPLWAQLYCVHTPMRDLVI